MHMCVCARPRAAGSMRARVRVAGGDVTAFVWCAALALACAALAAADDKRAEMSPVPFVMGSRYGRSPERVMTPRNDRFFMGSRYGKRSEMAAGGCGRGGCRLLCDYTGVLSLYTCVRQHTHLHFHKRGRGEDDAGPCASEED